jgi:hypothetical protein
MSSIIEAIWKYFVAAVAAGLTCWHLLYNYAPTADAFTGLNIIARLTLTTALCSVLYLVFIVLIYRGFGPISQFISLVRQMVPGLPSPKETDQED